MKTIVSVVNREKIEKAEIKKAAEILRKGGLVAFPTETVYGLGGNALMADASEKIYAAKGRPSDNPLIVHIADISELEPLVTEIPESAKILMEKYWPGPMTLIFKKSDAVPKKTTGGLNSVAIRYPSHPVANALIKECGFPIAAPSANTSGRPSPTTAAHVIDDLDGKIEMIIDGGSADIGLESTIIDVTGEKPELLRPGYISFENLKELFADAEIDRTVIEKPSADFRPKAPGMKYRHYAPKAPLSIIMGNEEDVKKKILSLTEESKAQKKKVGIICTKENADCYDADEIIVIGQKGNLDEIAGNLFDVLRKMDDSKVDIIFSEGFPDGGIGLAIMNRLRKAAGYNIINAEE